jgi:hypothetical protein
MAIRRNRVLMPRPRQEGEFSRLFAAILLDGECTLDSPRGFRFPSQDFSLLNDER